MNAFGSMWRWLVLTCLCLAVAACGGGGDGGGSPPSPVPVLSISAHPQDASVDEGQPAAFTVTATGSGTLVYQWVRDGVDVVGATSDTYQLASVAVGDDGAQFAVRVSDSSGSSLTSSTARLTVRPTLVIATQPQSATVSAGQTATFTVVVNSGAALTYQWRRDGVDIAGATGASYVTPALAASDSGTAFSVIVTAGASSATSADAVLTVSAAAVSQAVKFATSKYNTLAVRPDGSVIQLGSNAFTLTTTVPGTPVAGTFAKTIDGLPAAVDVSSSDTKVLVLGRDGKLYGWGDSTGGGLGGGTLNTGARSPVELTGLDGIVSAASIATYSVAVRNDGTVWHWPGVTTFTTSGTTVVPSPIAGLGGVVKVVHSTRNPSFDASTVFAIKSDGTVWELSWTVATVMGTTGPAQTVTGAATQLAALTDVIDIACGSHCLALKRDGTLLAWGDNNVGQLGIGATSNAVPVTSPVRVLDLVNVKAVAAGPVSVAVTQDGRVWIWGNGSSGLNAAGNLLYPTELTALSGAVDASCSALHCAVLLGDGSLWSWGANGGGELGDGTTVAHNGPLRAQGLLLTDATASISVQPVTATGAVGQTASFSVTATSSRAAALSYVWSRNGVPIAGATGASYTTPALTLADDDARFSVTVGDGSSPIRSRDAALIVTATPNSSATPGRVVADRLVAYTSAAGSAATWDWGDGSTSTGSPARKVWRQPGDYTVQPGSGSAAFGVKVIGATVALGSGHSCAIKADATVVCWGSNGFGQLGDGTVIDKALPVPVAGLGNVVAIAAGVDYTCALKLGGIVACWGKNDVGQVGDGTLQFKSVPTDVAALTDVTAIAAGDFHACALLRTGGVQCWGDNFFGAVGDGTTANNRTRPVAVAGLTDAVSIAAGSGSCAVRRTGEVACWGTLNASSGAAGFDQPVPTLVPGLANAVSVAFGATHVCALRTDQRVLCWGTNTSGELGDGSAVARSAPILVTGLLDAVAVAAGDTQTCALKSDGTVACWGSGADIGDPGEGATESFAVPVPRAVVGSAGSSAIYAGTGRTCAPNVSGQVLCWGSGAMADNSVNGQHAAPLPVRGGPSFWK